jgi:hypothetical protein
MSENLELEINDDEDQEIEEPIKIKKERKKLSPEAAEKRNLILKKAREKRSKYSKVGKETVNNPVIIEEVLNNEEEIEEEIIPVIIKKKTIKKQIYNEIEDESISEKDIKEYLRHKRNEENELKRVYMLKSQKNQEERFKNGMMSMFN